MRDRARADEAWNLRPSAYVLDVHADNPIGDIFVKLAALALSAAVLGVLSITPASAATLGTAVPSSAAIKHAANADVVKVQFSTKRKANRKGYRKGYRQGYRDVVG